MKSVLKSILIVLGGIILLLVLAVVVLNIVSRRQLAREYDVEVAAVPVPENDPEALARGEHLVTVVSECVGCHGEDLSGQPFFEEPPIGRVVSDNITPAALGDYSDLDYVRAIRHGLDTDNTPLLVMPAQHFQNMTDEDLGAAIAYLKSVPAVESDLPESSLTPLAHVLIATGQLEVIPAEQIDHDDIDPQAPPEGATAAYGEYLVSISTCRDCHGRALAGGQAGPGEPIGPNLTPGGELGEWDQADFFTLMRNGVHPGGREIDPFMPWEIYRNMTDTELEAIWLYLQSLPAREYQGP